MQKIKYLLILIFALLTVIINTTRIYAYRLNEKTGSVVFEQSDNMTDKKIHYWRTSGVQRNISEAMKLKNEVSGKLNIIFLGLGVILVGYVFINKGR